MSKRVRWVLRIGATALVLLLCVALLRKLELGRVVHVLRHADWRLVCLAVLLNLTVNLDSRTRRWWVLLRALPPPPQQGSRTALPGYRELLLLMVASYAANNILPARAGEALRTVQLRQLYGYRTDALVASLLVEKLIEVASLGVLGLVLAVGLRPPRGLSVPLHIVGVAGPAGLALSLVLAKRMGRGRPDDNRGPEHGVSKWSLSGLWRRARGFLGRVVQAMGQMDHPRTWLRAMLFSLVSDVADTIMVGLCLLAVGLHLGVAEWFMVFIAINLAIAVPTTPGQVGVLEAGAVLVLRLLGVADSEALVFALLYHAVHIVPVTAVGLPALHLVRLRRPAPLPPVPPFDPMENSR